jgi:hypothetical protein
MVSAPSLQQRLLELLHQREVPTSGSDDNEVHDKEHRVVAPSICSRFTPEACSPNENLLLDRVEHYGSELRENAKDHTETSGALSRAQKNRAALARTNLFR